MNHRTNGSDPAVDSRSQSGHRPEPHSAAGTSRPRRRGPVPDLPEQFDRFQVLERLGRGGMGSVYKAFDTEMNRHVALKVPHLGPKDGPEVLERFYREARAAATFDHPNLCPVYTVGQVDGVHYLAMSYLDGKPLSTCLGRSRPLPQPPVAALVRMLALAMEEAHRRGVVHRDLKPSNIVTDKHRMLVIVDFGLSLRAGWSDLDSTREVPLDGDARITRAGSVLGTPGYMAPEQVTGETAAMGPACDIYSLGVIMYELLTGRLPFEGPPSLVIGLIKVSEPPRPSTLRSDLHPTLEAICLKAMAKQPAERFASIAELAAALKHFLGGGDLSRPAQSSLSNAWDDAVSSEERLLVDRLLNGPRAPPMMMPQHVTVRQRRIEIDFCDGRVEGLGWRWPR